MLTLPLIRVNIQHHSSGRVRILYQNKISLPKPTYIPIERDLDARMLEQLAERFHINAALDALRCKGMPQGVKVTVWHAIGLLTGSKSH